MEETRKIIFKFFSPGCAFLQFLLPLPISPPPEWEQITNSEAFSKTCLGRYFFSE